MAHFNINANVIEYIFARVIEDHNLQVRHDSTSGNYIMASEGRALHREFLDRLAHTPVKDENGEEIYETTETCTPSRACKIMSEVFENRLYKDHPFQKYLNTRRAPGRAYDAERDADLEQNADYDILDPAIMDYMLEWQDITNIAIEEKKQAVQEIRRPDYGYIPASPFEEQYAMRDTVMNNGTEILYYPADMVIDFVQDENGKYRVHHRPDTTLEEDANATIIDENGHEVPEWKFYHKFYETDSAKNEKNTNYNEDYYEKRRRDYIPTEEEKKESTLKVQEAGPIADSADLAGITPFREFMTEKEFNTAKKSMEHMENGVGMTPQMSEQGVEICKHLRNLGIPFKITPGDKPGQLNAEISGKRKIRIADPYENGLYIGRIYDNGVSYLPSVSRYDYSTRKSMDFNSQEYKDACADVDIDIKLALIDYVLGRSVDMLEAPGYNNTVKIGTVLQAKPGRGTPPTAYFSIDEKTGRLEFHAPVGWLNHNSFNSPNVHGNRVSVRVKNNNSVQHLEFLSEQDADKWLTDAVASARNNFEAMFDIDRLIEEDKTHPKNEYPDYYPFSGTGDQSVEAVQRVYWNVLRGTEMLQPPENADELFNTYFPSLTNEGPGEEEVSVHANTETEDAPDGQPRADIEQTAFGLFYQGDPEDIIRAHLEDSLDLMFGTCEPDTYDENGHKIHDGEKHFSASLTAEYMDSGSGIARNEDNIIAAMQKDGLTDENLIGTDFETKTIKEKLLTYDPISARPMSWYKNHSSAQNDFIYDILNGIKTEIQETGCTVGTIKARDENGDIVDTKDDDICIDKNGVVHYTAYMNVSNGHRGGYTAFPVEGTVGQIFAPDEDGLIETKYMGSDNRLFSPGTEVSLKDRNPEHPEESFIGRMIPRGVEQAVMDDVRATVKQDLVSVHETYTTKSVPAESKDDTEENAVWAEVGTTTSVNSTYRGLIKTTYKVMIPPDVKLESIEVPDFDDDGHPIQNADGSYKTRQVMQEVPETMKETYERQKNDTHLSHEILAANYEENGNMIHFPKEMVNGSSTMAELQDEQMMRMANSITVWTQTNDNDLNWWNETGARNMAVTAENTEGLCDYSTTGSGKNTGAIRYLISRDMITVVTENEPPVFIPIENSDMWKDRDVLARLPENKYLNYVPADRQQMVASNLLNCSGVIDNVGVAQLTVQGLTFDDGAVISREFAEKYRVAREDIPEDAQQILNRATANLNELKNTQHDENDPEYRERYQNASMAVKDAENLIYRPLKPGDKICDFSGNKSVIAAVIDPNMDKATAEAMGIDKAVDIFRENPSLDVIQSPYSGVSRMNAASARWGLENNESLFIDGEEHKGCIGYMPMMVTMQTADEHTKNYDEDAAKRGLGRKISAQQAWMLSAEGCDAMMHEVYSSNNSTIINCREYLNILGYDMSETGDLMKGYHPQNNESRYVFKMPSEEETDRLIKATAGMQDKEITRTIGDEFSKSVGYHGGIMELPFPVKLFSGENTAETTKTDENGNTSTVYQLPVLSAHLRSGQSFDDESTRAHEYDSKYRDIYSNAVLYKMKMKEFKTLSEGKDPERLQTIFGKDEKFRTKTDNDYIKDMNSDNYARLHELVKSMNTAVKTAEKKYNQIATDIEINKFEDKHNIFRDDIMSRRMPNSATAIWTPKPMLKLNQIAVSPEIAKTLKVHGKKITELETSDELSDRIVVTRDPLIRTYGMRDMEVVIDDSITGVAVNPLIAVSFDGDFDGDSVGLQAFRSDEAKKESYDNFSFEQNMLNLSAEIKDENEKPTGKYELIINNSMDVVSSEYIDKENRQHQLEDVRAKYAEGTPEYENAIKDLYVDDAKYQKDVEEIEQIYEPGTDEYKHALDLIPESLEHKRLRLQDYFNEVYYGRNPYTHEQFEDEEDKKKMNEELTEDLYTWSLKVLEEPAATEIISYESLQKHMESLQQITDRGAKGSEKNLTEYLKYMGAESPVITNKEYPSGRHDFSEIKDLGYQQETEEDICNTEESMAIKAQETGVAGTHSQKVAAFLRDNETPGVMEAAMRLASMASDGLLQAKHDAKQAKKLRNMVSQEITNCWHGYKMERKQQTNPVTKEPETRWTVVKDENGQPIQAETDEWIQTFYDIHSDPEGLGLGRKSVSHRDVEMVAQALTDETGHILDIESDDVMRKYMSALDQLAYRPSQAKEILDDLCERHVNLFDGKMTNCFAPSCIEENKRLETEGKEDEMRAIQAQDTKSDNLITKHGRIKTQSIVSIQPETQDENGNDVLQASYIDRKAASKDSSSFTATADRIHKQEPDNEDEEDIVIEERQMEA